MLSWKKLRLFFRRKLKRETVSPDVSSPAVTRPVTGAVVSDVGCLRSNNEDNFILGNSTNKDCADHCEAAADNGQDFWFFAGVFDGMGGGEIGEVAAKTAVSVFLDAIGQIKGSGAQAQIDSHMREAFLEANNRIIDLQQQYHVFGTTGTILCTNGTLCKIYHLGDSRAYLVRAGMLSQITRDQTLAQMKIDVGLYRPDDPQAEADKHKLTEYIGRDPTRVHLRPMESEWFSADPGDLILLCSDGLYDMCSDREITDILSNHTEASRCAAALVEAAVSHGGEDNITCICLQFSSEIPPETHSANAKT